jgi:hypothetical protein
MKKPIQPRAPRAPKAYQDRYIRQLKKCLSELKKLYAEAVRILRDLLTSRSANEISALCERFHTLQEYFVMRYHQAEEYAISVLDQIETKFSLS